MDTRKEFQKYAKSTSGISSLSSDKYINSVYGSYISPTIIEERQLNIATMDVFSRLMMDRIIFLGTAIDDYVANIIQAQLLFLDSTDPGKDIQIYFNSPGGAVYAGLGIYAHHAIHLVAGSYHLYWYGRLDVSSTAHSWCQRQTFGAYPFADHDPSTHGRKTQGQAVDMEITVREL
jgi:ATP-dependent Clp protease protease subunit